MDNLIVKKLTQFEIDKIYELEEKYIGKCDRLSIEKTLDSETLSYYLLLKDEEVVGFFECSIISPEAELYDIVVDEGYQGLGYSKILMDYFINLVKDNNVETIFLEVNSMNYKALSLYKKYGFVEYSLRKNYYGNNDAVLMKKEI